MKKIVRVEYESEWNDCVELIDEFVDNHPDFNIEITHNETYYGEDILHVVFTLDDDEHFITFETIEPMDDPENEYDCIQVWAELPDKQLSQLAKHFPNLNEEIELYGTDYLRKIKRLLSFVEKWSKKKPTH